MTWSNMLLISVVISTIPFVLMSLKSIKINLDKKERCYQFLMPLIAVIYCIIGMVLVDKIAVGMTMLIEKLSRLISFIPLIGPLLSKLANILNLGFGVQLLANTILMTVFCLVKKIVLPLLKKYWTKFQYLYDQTSGVFYERMRGHRTPVLRQKYAYLRRFLWIFYYACVVLGALTCILSTLFRSSTIYKFPFYPVFAIIILGEITCFLSGDTSDERGQKRDDTDEEETNVDFERLRETFHKMFGDRICYESDEDFKKPAKKEKDLVEELSYSEDRLERIVGNYFDHVRKGGGTLDKDNIAAVNKLMHHESVILYNPFYKDFINYLLLPIFHELLNHNKCLIISGRITEEEEVKEWIEEAILQTTNLRKLWKVNFLGSESISADEEPDIGIISFRDIYNLKKLERSREFFEKTTMVVIIEPSNLLGTGQVGLRCILQLCEAEDKDITYCAFDRNCDGLVDALSHAVRKSITEVIASPTVENKYSQIFWRAEGPGIHNRILPKISHYMGIGTEIAALAMNQGVEDVHWYSSSKMPLLDLRWNVGQYYKQICNYSKCRMEQSELDARFHFHSSLWDNVRKENIFLLVEDEFCNLFEMGRIFASRIEDKGFLNILTENYMMRDYMCANGELFYNDPKAVPAIVPDYVRTERNFALRTIMMLAAAPQHETALHRELLIHGCEIKDVYLALRSMIEKYTDLSGDILQIEYKDEFDYKLDTVVPRKYFYIDSDAIGEIFDSSLRSAYYVVENEQYEKYHMGNRLMGHIEQQILPGQYFTFEGKYYQARTITKESGIIARRSGDQLNGRWYYRQMRTYRLKSIAEVAKTEVAKDFRGMKIHNYFADIDVFTDSYLELKSVNNLKTASKVELDCRVERSLKGKSIIQMELPEVTDEVKTGLAIVLNELFRSIYPNEYPYIVVTTEMDNIAPENKDNINALLPFLQVDCEAAHNSIYFIEDSHIDLGLLVSLERNIQRIFEIAADYLDWYINDPKEAAESDTMGLVSGNIQGNEVATTDIDGEDEETIDTTFVKEEYGPYFHLGFEEQPAWLDLLKTLEYLKKYQFLDSNIHRFRKNEGLFDDGSSYDPAEPGTHYCDFCGCVLEPGTYDVLKDGRERCPECGKDAVKSVKQFRRIYKETMREMEEIFGIEINVPVKVRMANAKKVNEHFGYKPTRFFDARAIGYAQDTGKGYNLYIENGAPLWSTKTTIVHELTHIWQFTNWDMQEVMNRYGQEMRQEVVEGMAVWTEVQYLLSMDEKERAIRYKRSRDADPSEYGRGMKKYLAKYPPKEQGRPKNTPFKKYPPL